MDVVQRQTALCHPVRSHRAVDAAGEHVQSAAGSPHGQTALAGDLRAVDVGTVIADLHDDLELRVVDIHLEVVVFAQQIGTQLPHQFRAGHGVGLVGAAGLHLEGLDAVEAVAEVIFRRLADGVEVLFAVCFSTMLQNTPENKLLPGRHPHSDRKRVFAVCYCVITL